MDDLIIDYKEILQLPVVLQDNANYLLSNLVNNKWLVLYFYPKDATSGCTLQATDFTALKDEFSQLNAVVVGVSRDSVNSHIKFIDKYALGIALVSDTDEKLCQNFDVIKNKNMYGKVVRGIERSTFLFNPNGQLVKEWRKVRSKDHAQHVLDTLKIIQNAAI